MITAKNSHSKILTDPPKFRRHLTETVFRGIVEDAYETLVDAAFASGDFNAVSGMTFKVNVPQATGEILILPSAVTKRTRVGAQAEIKKVLVAPLPKTKVAGK